MQYPVLPLEEFIQDIWKEKENTQVGASEELNTCKIPLVFITVQWKKINTNFKKKKKPNQKIPHTRKPQEMEEHQVGNKRKKSYAAKEITIPQNPNMS